MSKGIIKKCEKFLNSHDEKFQDPNFKHITFIVDILPHMKDGQFNDKFRELETNEVEVDELVQEIVHERFDQFNSLMGKPMVYGEKYDNVKKIVTNSRKKIKRSKELLSKRNDDIKNYLFNSVYNKEILKILEKVDDCQNLFVKIDTLIKNESFYEICQTILKLKHELAVLKDYDDCYIVKNLIENEKLKVQETSQLIRTFFRTFFYFVKEEFYSKIYIEKELNQGVVFDKLNLKPIPTPGKDKSVQMFFKEEMTEKEEEFYQVLLKNYRVDSENLFLFEQKLAQIKIILSQNPKNTVVDNKANEFMLTEPETSENIHLIKYIDYALEVGQYNKYMELITKAERLLEREPLSTSQKGDIMNLFLAVKSSQKINISSQIFSDYYGNLRKNISNALLMIQILSVKSIWSLEKQQQEQMMNDDYEEFAQLLYNNFKFMQQNQFLSEIQSNQPDLIRVHMKKNLLTIFKFDPNNAKYITDMFKQITIFLSIFFRKNALLQTTLVQCKDQLSELPIVSLVDSWKVILMEIESLFDRLFKVENIDVSLLNDPAIGNRFFETAVLPSTNTEQDEIESPDDVTSRSRSGRRGSIDFKQLQQMSTLKGPDQSKGTIFMPQNQEAKVKKNMGRRGSADLQQLPQNLGQQAVASRFGPQGGDNQNQSPPQKGKQEQSILQTTLEKVKSTAKKTTLEDFLCDKLRGILHLNFLYIPIILAVIYKPLINISYSLESIISRTQIGQLFPEKKNISALENGHGQINHFLKDNFKKFLVLFKLEYIKLTYNYVNNNEQINLKPIKNVNKEEYKDKNKLQNKYKNKAKANPPQAKKDQKPKEDEEEEEEKQDLAQSTTSLLLKEAQKKNELTLSSIDVAESFQHTKHFIPALVNMCSNLRVINSMVLYLPNEKSSNMLDLLNWTMNCCHQELLYHTKQNIQGSNIDKLFDKPQDFEHIRYNLGQNSLLEHLSKSFPFVTEKIEKKANSKIYFQKLKESYRDYFSGDFIISDQKLLSNEKSIYNLISYMENLEVFLKVCYSTFWNIVLKFPADSILNVLNDKIVSNSKSQGKIYTYQKNNESTKEIADKLKKKIEYEGLETLLSKHAKNEELNLNEPPHFYRHITEDSPEVGVAKFLKRFNEILNLMTRIFTIVKIDLHMKCFAYLIRDTKIPNVTVENNPSELSAQNFTSLYRETYSFYETLRSSVPQNKVNMIFDDYYALVMKIVKFSFIRAGKTSAPYVKTYLHNILSLENNMKKFDQTKELAEQKEAHFDKMKRFLNLFLYEDSELVQYIKNNRSKIKKKHIEQFIQLKKADLRSESKIQEKESLFKALLKLMNKAPAQEKVEFEGANE